MQTFLPFSDFRRSAESLDDKRLGKQRVEAYQLLGVNLDARLITTANTGQTRRVETIWHPDDYEVEAFEMVPGVEYRHEISEIPVCGELLSEEWTVRPRNRTAKGKIPWASHPAAKMWLGYERLFLEYILVMCDVWTQRGFNDTVAEKSTMLYGLAAAAAPVVELADPPWLGREDVHESHRSVLIRKFPEHYRPQFAENTEEGLEYVWPVD